MRAFTAFFLMVFYCCRAQTRRHIKIRLRLAQTPQLHLIGYPKFCVASASAPTPSACLFWFPCSTFVPRLAALWGSFGQASLFNVWLRFYSAARLRVLIEAFVWRLLSFWLCPGLEFIWGFAHAFILGLVQDVVIMLTQCRQGSFWFGIRAAIPHRSLGTSLCLASQLFEAYTNCCPNDAIWCARH